MKVPGRAMVTQRPVSTPGVGSGNITLSRPAAQVGPLGRGTNVSPSGVVTHVPPPPGPAVVRPLAGNHVVSPAPLTAGFMNTHPLYAQAHPKAANAARAAWNVAHPKQANANRTAYLAAHPVGGVGSVPSGALGGSSPEPAGTPAGGNVTAETPLQGGETNPEWGPGGLAAQSLVRSV
jgi:hypothetical protein